MNRRETWPDVRAPRPAGTIGDASAAAAALAAVNPCVVDNVAAVWAFQQSIGQDPDGKYGSDTAHKLAEQVPAAPPGCHPRPKWWAPHGQKNLPGDGVSPAPKVRVPTFVRTPTPVAPTAPSPVPSRSDVAVVLPPSRPFPMRNFVVGSVGVALVLVGIVMAVDSREKEK